MDIWLAAILAQLAEESLHLACGLVHINNFARLLAHAGPHVRNLARDEDGFARAGAKLLFANGKLEFAFEDVYPLILVVVEMARAAASAGELENAQCAICVPGRHLTIIRLASEFDWLIKPVFSRGDTKTQKHLFTRHLLRPFQVLDGFVDGFDQGARPGEVVLESLAVRLKGGGFLEIGPAEDFLNLLQFEAQLPVEQDLLEHQELRFFIESVAICTLSGRLQQTNFIVEMKRSHAHSRYSGDALNCDGHAGSTELLLHASSAFSGIT